MWSGSIIYSQYNNSMLFLLIHSILIHFRKEEDMHNVRKTFNMIRNKKFITQAKKKVESDFSTQNTASSSLLCGW